MPFFVSWRRIDERIDMQCEVYVQEFREEQQAEGMEVRLREEFHREMENLGHCFSTYMEQYHKQYDALHEQQLKEQLLRELRSSAWGRQPAVNQRAGADYERKIAALEKRMEEQERQLREVYGYAKKLEEQIAQLRQTPYSVQPRSAGLQPKGSSAQSQRPASGASPSSVQQHSAPGQQQRSVSDAPRPAQQRFVSDAPQPAQQRSVSDVPQPAQQRSVPAALQPVQPLQPAISAFSPAAAHSVCVIFQEDEVKNQRSIRQFIFQCTLLRKEWEERYGEDIDYEIYFKILDKCGKKFSDLAAKLPNKKYSAEGLAAETVRILKQTIIKALARESIRPDVEHFLEKCMLRKVIFVPGQELSDDDYEYVDDLVFYEDVQDKRQHNCIVEVIQDAFAVGYAEDGDTYEAVIPGVYKVGRYKQS